MTLYISNLSSCVSEHQLVELFERFGTVLSVQLPIDSLSGLPKGYAFVEMPNDEESSDALNGLNHYVFAGATIYVERAQLRTKAS